MVKARAFFKPASELNLQYRGISIPYNAPNNFELEIARIIGEPLDIRIPNYMLAAAVDLERAHGLSLEDELIDLFSKAISRNLDGHVQGILQAGQ